MSYPPGPPNEGDSNPQDPYPTTPGQQPGYGPPGAGEPGYGEPGYGPPGYGPPPGYTQQPGYGGGPAPSTNGKALASLITGIAAVVLSWCCVLGLGGLVAVFLGVKARSDIKASAGMQTGDGIALAGIITGAIGALLGLLGLIFVIVAIATGSGDWDMGTYADY